MTPTRSLALLGAAAILALAAPVEAQQAKTSPNMSFFLTSTGSGKGADLGGLAGADRHCQSLAAAVGSKKTWRAYLSTQDAGGQRGVNARDRIGKGPWRNASGMVIANDLTELHGPNKINEQNAMTEKATWINGRTKTPNQHDILTGSQEDGTKFPAGSDMTCGNWTLSGTEGAAMVGHHDRQGLRDDAPSKSWVTSHPTRGGCSQTALQGTGGAGLFYCFATN